MKRNLYFISILFISINVHAEIVTDPVTHVLTETPCPVCPTNVCPAPIVCPPPVICPVCPSPTILTQVVFQTTNYFVPCPPAPTNVNVVGCAGPNNLTMASATTGSVTLAWQNSGNWISNMVCFVAGQVSGTSTTLTVSGLPAGTTTLPMVVIGLSSSIGATNVTPIIPPATSFALRINCGASNAGLTGWTTDTTGSQQFSVLNPVTTTSSNPPPGTVLQSYTTDTVYQVTGAIPNMAFTARFWVCDYSHNAAGVGIWNLLVNGAVAVSHVDPFALAGKEFAATAVTVTGVTSAAGTVSLGITYNAQSSDRGATLAAIEFTQGPQP